MTLYLTRQLPFTCVAFGVALATMIAASLWNINVFELPALSIIGIEQNEIGEVVVAFLLLVPAFFVDGVFARQRAYDTTLHAEQLRVLRVTMRTVQDIVNNNLNQLQLLRVEAVGCVPDEVLGLFDHTIHDTAAQLTMLANMETFAEKPMATGQGLDAGAAAAMSSAA